MPIRSAFYTEPWGSAALERNGGAGIERVVFGHTPQADGPVVFHEGHSLCIDMNAVADPYLPATARSSLTLVGLAGLGTPGSARLVTIDTRGAPDAAPSPLGRS